MNIELKKIYEDMSMVNYYDDLVKIMNVINSEKIIFEKYLNISDRILDVGCGAGRTTIYLYERGFKDIVGVDISKNMINRARKNNENIKFFTSDIKSFEDQELYDTVIFSFNGLMLIKTYKERLSVCKKINKLLNEDGKFIFTTPFLDNKYTKESWVKRLYEHESTDNWEYGDIYMDDLDVENIYIHIPFKKEINNMLIESGFEIVDSYRRLDICEEIDYIEEHLDDNIYWIARKI